MPQHLHLALTGIFQIYRFQSRTPESLPTPSKPTPQTPFLPITVSFQAKTLVCPLIPCLVTSSNPLANPVSSNAKIYEYVGLTLSISLISPPHPDHCHLLPRHAKTKNKQIKPPKTLTSFLSHLFPTHPSSHSSQRTRINQIISFY